MIRIQKEEFSIDDIVQTVSRESSGAVVMFLGTVRADPGVVGLAFDVYHEMAEKKLRELRETAMKRFDLDEMAIVHRFGRLNIGEPITLVAAVAPHRKEAFAACEWTMDELKKVIPIWKEEIQEP